MVLRAIVRLFAHPVYSREAFDCNDCGWYFYSPHEQSPACGGPVDRSTEDLSLP